MTRSSTPRPGDIVVAGAAVLLAVFYTILAVEEASGAVWIEAVLSWGFVATLLFWRRRVSAVAVTTVILLGLWAANWILALPANLGVTPWLLAAPMIVWSTTRQAPDQRWWGRGILAVTLAGSVFSPAMWQVTLAGPVYRTGHDWVVFLALHCLVLLCIFLIGAGQVSQAQARQQRIAAAVRERELKMRAAREEERILIAGEIHDVLAHSLTLIKVNANAGLKLGRQDPAVMTEHLREIHGASAAGLDQVRDIVTALREDNHELRPAPQLSELPELIAGFEHAGLDVESRLPGDLPRFTGTLSALTQLAVVRIVAEALTNVLRHQGSGSAVKVNLDITESVEIEVSSTSGTTAIGETGGGTGTGLLGLAERARALGGQLQTSGDVHQFRVHATFPKAEVRV